jgi:YVTN family beta-propeller protein
MGIFEWIGRRANKDSNGIQSRVVVGVLSFAGAVNAVAQNAYIANSGDDTITIIDTANYKIMGTMQAGARPWRVALTPYGKRLYVTHRPMPETPFGTMTVLDTETRSIMKTMTLDGIPGTIIGVTIAPDGKTAYVATGSTKMPEGNAVTAIDTKTNSVAATIIIPPDRNGGSYPYALAVSPDGKRLYATHRRGDSISVIDTQSNKLVRTIRVSAGEFSLLGGTAIAVSPGGDKLYVGGAGGTTFAVVTPDTGTVDFPRETHMSMYVTAVAVTPDGGRLYFGAQGGLGFAFDTRKGTFVTSAEITENRRVLNVGPDPASIAVKADGSTVLMTDSGGNTVCVIDTTLHAVLAFLRVGSHPVGIAIDQRPAGVAKR